MSQIIAHKDIVHRDIVLQTKQKCSEYIQLYTQKLNNIYENTNKDKYQRKITILNNFCDFFKENVNENIIVNAECFLEICKKDFI